MQRRGLYMAAPVGGAVIYIQGDSPAPRRYTLGAPLVPFLSLGVVGGVGGVSPPRPLLIYI